MIIKQIRLKNIKSFGEGPAGTGVLIQLERGINRIGGRNGSGKSSIIEAMGYALFDAEPVRGDNRLKIETYLVRNGAKTGEIDVWVESSDCVYRIERDAGQIKRRWKVLRDDDQFIEAEGDTEVRAFLTQLWGVAGPYRLSDIYHGLIGVKQGQFTRPFDCTPAMARSHFDPLLDVDIFRECFDYLLKPFRELEELQHSFANKSSGIGGQLAQLQDAAGRLEQYSAGLAEVNHKIASLQAMLHTQAAVVKNHEAAAINISDAELAVKEAESQWQAAQIQGEHSLTALHESETALAVLTATDGDYRNFIALETEYRKLEEQRSIREGLLQQENELAASIKVLQENISGKQATARQYREQSFNKQTEAQQREDSLGSRRQDFEKLAQTAEEQAQQSKEAVEAVNAVVNWYHTLERIQQQLDQELPLLAQLSTELALFNPLLLQETTAELERARLAETAAEKELAVAVEGRDQLQQQLASINGGICPFLAEKCHQFQPERVKDQLGAAEQRIKEGRDRSNQAAQACQTAKKRWEALQQAEREYLEGQARLENGFKSLTEWWRQVENNQARHAIDLLDRRWPGPKLIQLSAEPAADTLNPAWWSRAAANLHTLIELLKERLTEWHREVKKMAETSQALMGQKEKEAGIIASEAGVIEALKQEASSLEALATEQSRLAEATAAELNQVTLKRTAIIGQLEQFSNLKEQMALTRNQMEQYKDGHRRYLQNQPAAAKFEERKNKYYEDLQRSTALGQGLEAARNQLEVAKAEYDLNLHNDAKQKLQELMKQAGEAQAIQDQMRKAMEAEAVRFNTYQQLKADYDQLLQEIDQVQAELKVLETARNVLKNSQALVAESLTREIQGRAQAIFNSMSQEPVRFEWDNDYRLTIHTASGPRRFAQLSGGQQMKAALAMQLSLVKEFSKAGFCAFDEPTYGLDQESRSLLADAILKAQQECGFEQLLIVSHDESFDDRIEHQVNLLYSAAHGTYLSGID